MGQAKIAFESRDFTKFESLLLRAQRPELAVKQYRDQVDQDKFWTFQHIMVTSCLDQGMWPEALRVCKEYLPHRLRALQVEEQLFH